MMPTARQKVLAYLKKARGATAAQIGRALQMRPAAVRHHLSIMLADGRVQVVGEGRAAGRGRPAQFYGLAPNIRGDNLANALGALLDEAPRRQGFLEQVGERLAGNPDPANAPLGRRLAAAVAGLNQMHYEARWEAGSEGPRILLANCPYAAIIEAHPELCRMDAGLISARIGLPAWQTAKMERGGPFVCVFVLGGRSDVAPEGKAG